MKQASRWALLASLSLGTALAQYSVLAARGSYQVVGSNSQARPLVVFVSDLRGNPVAGQTVTFTAQSPAGSFVSPTGVQTLTATAKSDVLGLAEAPPFVVGGVLGQFNIQAAVGAGIAQFTVVVGNPLNVTLAINPLPAFYGERTTLQAFVNPNPSSGRVAFYDGPTLLGNAIVNVNGVATLRTILPHSGVRHISARYNGGPYTPKPGPATFPLTVRALPVKAFGAAAWSAPIAASAIAVGDFNSDGNQDLAVASGNAVQIYLGNGNGTFITGSRHTATGAAAIAQLWTADINADGAPDLVTFDGTNSISVALNTGAGNFTVVYSSGSTASPNPSTAIADFDGDGFTDFVNSTGVTYFGAGDGSFSAISAPSPLTYVFPQAGPGNVIDYNGDGIPDIVQSNFGGLSFFAGTGSGRFTAGPTTPLNLQNLVIEDLNNDGLPEIFGFNPGSGGYAELIAASGANIITGALPGPINGATAVDLNGDGLQDIMVFVTLNGGANAAYILYANGDGSLQVPVAVPSVISPQFGIGADFNGDGIPDLVISTGSTIAVQLGGSGGALSVYSANANGTLPGGITSAAYAVPLAAGGGLARYSFAITSGSLPPGLTLTVNRLGTGADITGTPTSAGAFAFTVTVTDALGHASSTAFSLSVASSPLSFPPQSLPAGFVGVSYFTAFAASGGFAPLTYTYSGVTVPAGLLLNANGTITGTPLQAGTYTIPVTLTDSVGQSSFQSLQLVIATLGTSRLPGRNVGVFRGGQWWLDTTGDRQWIFGQDLLFVYGQPGDVPILGDWTNTGVERYGIFRGGQWWLDLNADRLWTQNSDTVFTYGQPGDVPIFGDWDNTGRQRIGIFRNGQWWLDMNGDNQWTPDQDILFTYGQAGDIPIFGDWDNTGRQRIGVFRGGQWWLDINGDHLWTQGVDTLFTYGQPGDAPIFGDWTGTGVLRFGVFRNGQWWLDINGDRTWTADQDVLFTLGQPGDLPVLKRVPF